MEESYSVGVNKESLLLHFSRQTEPYSRGNEQRGVRNWENKERRCPDLYG